MTASTRQGRAAVRVRVERIAYNARIGIPEWHAVCLPCHWTSMTYSFQIVAMDAAIYHASYCPSLRLAALTRELEKLRDGWHERASRSTDERDPDYAFEIASVSLGLLLTEVRGC